MNGNKIQITIVEDELMVSGMLTAWVARFRDMELVGCAADGVLSSSSIFGSLAGMVWPYARPKRRLKCYFWHQPVSLRPAW